MVGANLMLEGHWVDPVEDGVNQDPWEALAAAVAVADNCLGRDLVVAATPVLPVAPEGMGGED